jgi:molybdopterin molybdotransferase
VSPAGPLTAAAALHVASSLAIRAASEWVPLGEMTGRILAEPVRATAALPVAPTAAMDGWALRASQTPGRLLLSGGSSAGGQVA